MGIAIYDHLDLYLFTTAPAMAERSVDAGVDGVVVDWESKGKAARQRGYDTDTGGDTPEDLEAVAATAKGGVLVRVDADPGLMPLHIEKALSLGATSLMLPVAESPDDVARFLDVVRGRARTVIQIETQRLVMCCESLMDLPWDAAYIGLNDLMISRGSRWLWQPLVDGTVEGIFGRLPGRKIGFGGVTALAGGSPLPFVSLLGEMARLGCAMSFLRRSFHRDIVGRSLHAEIEAIRAVWRCLRARSDEAVERDRVEFERLVMGTRPMRWASGG